MRGKPQTNSEKNIMLGKHLKLNDEIKTLLDNSNSFYQNSLGYPPEQTSLEQVPRFEWVNFTQSKGLNTNCQGIYLPRNQTAIIKGQNPLSLFHEYFGHGLYCEQSLKGRKLVELEKSLLKEEKQKFQGRKFNLEDIQRFRSENSVFQKLDKFKMENLGQYELFAIWTEYLLSKEFGFERDFRKKYASLENREKEHIDSTINFSEQYGNLAAFYAQGMARIPTPKRVKNLLEEIYGTRAVNNSKLILLTGSKKPFSDIDLFASSNYLQSIENDWLDLMAFNEKDFEKMVKLFETQVTHPIMSGEFIAGDKEYLQQIKKQLQTQPITKEAINHNLQKSRKNDVAAKATKDGKLKKLFDSYAQTYLANALALKGGKRIFIKDELLPIDSGDGSVRKC